MGSGRPGLCSENREAWQEDELKVALHGEREVQGKEKGTKSVF